MHLPTIIFQGQTVSFQEGTFCLFSEVTVVHLEIQAATAQVADPLRVFPPSSRGPPKSTPPTAAKGSSQGQTAHH